MQFKFLLRSFLCLSKLNTLLLYSFIFHQKLYPTPKLVSWHSLPSKYFRKNKFISILFIRLSKNCLYRIQNINHESTHKSPKTLELLQCFIKKIEDTREHSFLSQSFFDLRSFPPFSDYN